MNSYSEMPLGEFLEQAASGSPIPGGGGVAALAGALGVAMAMMTANFTVGRPKYAAYEKSMQETIAKMRVLMAEMRNAVDVDARAFSMVSEACRLPKEDEVAADRRKAAIQQALTASMQVPLEVLKRCAKAAELLPALAGTGNPNLLSDADVAGIMLEACARCALANVLVNSRQLMNADARVAEREAEEMVRRVVELSAQVTGIVAGRRAQQGR